MKYAFFLIFIFFQNLAFAQNIEVLELETARIYDPGVSDAETDMMDANLWKGTSALTAMSLINKIPTKTSSKTGGKLIRAAILSGGVPPEGERIKYVSARLRYVMKMHDKDALKTLMAGYADYVHLPKTRVEYALGRDDIVSACDISDNLKHNRGLPYWIKIRVFCNINRDELAAAGLAVELLQNMGYQDRRFYELVDFLLGYSEYTPKITNNLDPLIGAMESRAKNSDIQKLMIEASNDKLNLNETMDIINQLSNQIKYDQVEKLLINGIINNKNIQIEQTPINQLQPIINDGNAMPSIEKQSIMDDKSLFSIKVLSSILSKADTHTSFSHIVKSLDKRLANVSFDQMEASDIGVFVRASLERKDYALLNELYEELPDGGQKTKIMIILAILENTYNSENFLINLEASSSDTDSEYYLSDRDIFILSSLRVSSPLPFLSAIEGKGEGNGFAVRAGDILLLKSTARNFSVAETALRAAIILENSPLNDTGIYDIIDALISAGLTGFAKDIAIEDFVRRL